VDVSTGAMTLVDVAFRHGQAVNPSASWFGRVPFRSHVKGWKISPSFYVNQDLATIWLDN